MLFKSQTTVVKLSRVGHTAVYLWNYAFRECVELRGPLRSDFLGHLAKCGSCCAKVPENELFVLANLQPFHFKKGYSLIGARWKVTAFLLVALALYKAVKCKYYVLTVIAVSWCCHCRDLMLFLILCFQASGPIQAPTATKFCVT